MAQLKRFCQVTNGSQTVTITGADFAAQIIPGSLFFVEGEFVTYIVASAVFSGGNTVVTLTGTYQGSTSPTAPGAFTKDLLSPSEIPLMSIGDAGKSVIFNEAMARIQRLYLEYVPTGAAAAAIDSADDAQASATAASTAANEASVAAAAAVAAKGAAETAYGTVSAEIATIATKVTDATTAANNAATAAGVAQLAAAEAESARDAVLADQVLASDAVDKADDWANAAVGIEVEPGLFSAKHWAAQSAAGINNHLVYMGAWDASGGSYPGTPATGHYYRVSVAGTVSSIGYGVGDAIVYNGTSWDKIDNTESITSYTDVPGLSAELASKADVSHAHSWAQISGKPTTLAGYGITDALSSNSPQVQDSVTISGTVPGLEFVETDQATSAGRYRAVVSGGVMYWRRNTSPSGNFASESTILSIGADDVVNFYQTPYVGASEILHAGNFNPATKLDAAQFTAQNILNLLKQVDGVDSGLDADLFDGLPSTAFARPIFDTNFVNVRVQGFQTWHEGNYEIPVRTVNGIEPDLDGNIEIDIDGTVGSAGLFPGAIVEFVPGTLPPTGWVKLEGQVLPIAGNESLYAMLGDANPAPVADQFTLPTRTNMAIRTNVETQSTVKVTKDLVSVYDILQLATKDFVAQYDILTTMDKDFSATWDMFEYVTMDFSASYDIQN